MRNCKYGMASRGEKNGGMVTTIYDDVCAIEKRINTKVEVLIMVPQQSTISYVVIYFKQK